MSEYYLADLKAEERARQRELEQREQPAAAKNQQMKVTMLGDFLFPTAEPQGCDPYNNTQGKAERARWRVRRERR
jgi:hypothetical protein